MLHRVERRSLGGEQRAGATAQPQQVGAGGDAGAVLNQPLEGNIGIERAEERFGDAKASDGDRVTAVHRALEHRVARDHRGRGDIAAIAQILGQGRRDEAIKVEAVEREGHGCGVPMFGSAASRRCSNVKRTAMSRRYGASGGVSTSARRHSGNASANWPPRI